MPVPIADARGGIVAGSIPTPVHFWPIVAALNLAGDAFCYDFALYGARVAREHAAHPLDNRRHDRRAIPLRGGTRAALTSH